MEAWTFLNYRRPYLRTDHIRRNGAIVTLIRDSQSLSVHCSTSRDAEQAALRLQALRQPENAVWSEVRGAVATADESWHELLSQLDDLQFVSDAMAETASEPKEQEPAVAAAIEFESQRIADEADTPVRRRHLLDLLSQLIEEGQALRLHTAIAGSPAGWDSDGRALPIDGDNFFVAVLRCQLRHFLQSSPASLRAVLELFVATCLLLKPRERDVVGQTLAQASRSQGLHDADGVVTHVASVAWSCRAALWPSARRLVHGPTTGCTPCTGSEFALRAEALVQDTLSRLGPGRYVQAAKRARDSSHPLVLGTYVEQYHVTRRFVEIVTPLLSMRLNPQLRALLFRYFFEEYGHEKFERETCLALGIDADELDASVPLPLTTAFVDILTALAAADPLGFLAAVTATEGLHGQSFKISDLLVKSETADLKRAAGRHDSLNAELNHASIPRLALVHVDAVAVGSQARALAHLVFILELSHRCWEGLYEFQMRRTKFRLHTRPASPRAGPNGAMP